MTGLSLEWELAALHAGGALHPGQAVLSFTRHVLLLSHVRNCVATVASVFDPTSQPMWTRDTCSHTLLDLERVL